MIVQQGKGVSKGAAKGPIYFYQRGVVTVSTETAADIEEEKRRLEDAKEKSMEQLTALAEKAREEAGDESAILFETQLTPQEFGLASAVSWALTWNCWKLFWPSASTSCPYPPPPSYPCGLRSARVLPRHAPLIC